MQITLNVPDSLAQEVIDFVDFLKIKYAHKSLTYSLPNEVVSGSMLSEQSLAKDWLNDEEDGAINHLMLAQCVSLSDWDNQEDEVWNYVSTH